VIVEAMVLDSILSTPGLRSPSFKRQFAKYELGSWSVLVNRHRFLLYALALLTVLCTIYLYFAIKLGANDSCSGLSGPQKVSCQMELVKVSAANGKLKSLRYFWFQYKSWRQFLSFPLGEMKSKYIFSIQCCNIICIIYLIVLWGKMYTMHVESNFLIANYRGCLVVANMRSLRILAAQMNLEF